MAFVFLLTRDVDVERGARRALEDRHVVARAGGWERLLHTVRERPVTCVIVDDGCLGQRHPWSAASELRERFPSVPVVWLARSGGDPFDLLRLGRAGVERLLHLGGQDLERELHGNVAKALGRGTEALVTREISPYLPQRLLVTVRWSLDAVHRRLSADQVAEGMGLSRPHLSLLLKGQGLPSLGHLLVWGRLLHAGRWLADPGRSAESVSRQLDYSSGAAFRRALRRYVGATPTEVLEGGGYSFVMDRFMDRCGLVRPLGEGRNAA